MSSNSSILFRHRRWAGHSIDPFKRRSFLKMPSVITAPARAYWTMPTALGSDLRMAGAASSLGHAQIDAASVGCRQALRSKP
jgi:hypothetical protein